jgi:DNA-binding NarL/FixJ family response regulator
MPITVGLVEDDAVVRASLADGLAADADFAIAFSVGTCRDALEALARTRLDALIVDLGLPDGDGLDVVAAAHRRDAALDIMVFSVFGDERRVVQAIRNGASGYLLKDQPGPEIAEAIRELIAGRAPISPGIAKHLIRTLQNEAPPARTEPAEPDPDCPALTEREREILVLVAKGFSYKECARLLDLSVHTVAAYVKRVYRKLAVGSRNEALFEARRLGLMRGD